MIKISDLLISQYYNSANLRGVLESFQGILQKDIGDNLEPLRSCMGIKAEGVWLELLAARFAIRRPLVPDEFSKYFGLVEDGESTEGKGTFSQAPFAPDGRGGIAGKQPTSDASFRIILAMRCAALSSRCTHDELLRLLESLLPQSTIIDNQDMTGTVELKAQDGRQADAQVIKSNFHLFPRPSGVSYDVSIMEDE